VYLANLQTRYLLLRGTIRYLTGIFILFKQYRYVGELLNDISWGTGKRSATLRHDIVSRSHRLLLADVTLHEKDGYLRVSVSDKGKAIAFETIDVIQEETSRIKTRIEVARGFMDERAVHLTAYESFLDRIEGELRESIRSAQSLLYRVDDSDLWREMREILVQQDDDFLQLIEALPDYDQLEIDQDAYRAEEEILLKDKY
jgi:hypothetical protein